MITHPKAAVNLISVSVSDAKKKHIKGRVDRSEIQALKDVTINLKTGDRVYIDPDYHQERIFTLFKLIIGTITPTRGTLKVEGANIIGPNPSFSILPRATLEENLILRALKLGHSLAFAKEYKAKVLSVENFYDYRNFSFMELPQNLKSMVLSESLMIIRPSVLLMAGWMEASSESFKEILNKRLVKLIDNSGIALVAVRRPELVLPLCTHRLDFTDMGEITITEL